jgi:threonine/homoserine/homoserine lactone efflux protein
VTLIYVTEGMPLLRHKRLMTLIELAFALLALLATPGPTNTLLALAGAQAVRRPLLLPLVELAAYMTTVVPLSIWGQNWLEATPRLRLILTLAAAVWVAVLAVRMWRHATRAEAQGAPGVTALQVGVTTLLNPKALVFGLVLIPSGPDVVAGLWLFAALVIVVSLAWLWLGARLAGRYQPLVNRGGAVWLGVLAALLLGRVLAA